MTLKEYQLKVDEWIKTIGVRYFDELTNTVILSEEVGELSRLMARVYGEQSFKTETSNEEAKEKIADEMADIIWVITCLANQTNIDLENALHKNLSKKNVRDKNRHKNNSKLQ